MSEVLVGKLLESFDELERCIAVTKQALSEREGVPSEVLIRVGQYSDIVTKQRSLAGELKSHVSTQNWSEVGRLVKIINGLSSMIRDDAQAILSGTFRAEEEEKEQVLC